MISDKRSESRRGFLKNAALISGTLLVPGILKAGDLGFTSKKVPVFAHLWVYASSFPPHWDSTPVLENAFSDLSYAGIDGIELMEINLKGDNSVSLINGLISKYKLPVSGTSYNAIKPMYDKNNHDEVLAEFTLVADRLKMVGGKTFGISVGDAGRVKTEEELDVQAAILREMLAVCKQRGLLPNLHNHTYEVVNGMHDLKGTLKRIPDVKLGPDLNWLIRGGVDPVEFIDTYGKQIVYMHIRDQYANGTWTEYVGQGATDFRKISQALTRQNFKGQAAIELAFPEHFKPENPLKQDWKMSREFVRKEFGW